MNAIKRCDGYSLRFALSIIFTEAVNNLQGMKYLLSHSKRIDTAFKKGRHREELEGKPTKTIPNLT